MKKPGLFLTILLALFSNGIFAQATWLDTTFGNGGIVIEDSLTALSMLIQQDNRIVIGGGSGFGFSMLRLSQNGSIDSSFGNSGYVFTPPSIVSQSSYWVEVLSLAQQHDGKILAAGLAGGIHI